MEVNNLIKARRHLLVILCGALFIKTSVLDCLAENACSADKSFANVGQQVVVRVRTIRASDSEEGMVKQGKMQNFTADVSANSHIDSELSDLKSKLESLHFKTFKLLSNEEVTVPLKRKTVLNLTDKTTLIIRPLYMEDERIGMWIKWADMSGNEVLIDTRMHFDSQESMITGTDSKEDRGLILAINARPK